MVPIDWQEQPPPPEDNARWLVSHEYEYSEYQNSEQTKLLNIKTKKTNGNQCTTSEENKNVLVYLSVEIVY